MSLQGLFAARELRDAAVQQVKMATQQLEFVFLSHSLLQGIKKEKPNRVSCDADEITIYSKQESCSLPFSLLERMQNGWKKSQMRKSRAALPRRALPKSRATRRPVESVAARAACSEGTAGR